MSSVTLPIKNLFRRFFFRKSSFFTEAARGRTKLRSHIGACLYICYRREIRGTILVKTEVSQPFLAGTVFKEIFYNLTLDVKYFLFYFFTLHTCEGMQVSFFLPPDSRGMEGIILISLYPFNPLMIVKTFIYSFATETETFLSNHSAYNH